MGRIIRKLVLNPLVAVMIQVVGIFAGIGWELCRTRGGVPWWGWAGFGVLFVIPFTLRGHYRDKDAVHHNKEMQARHKELRELSRTLPGIISSQPSRDVITFFKTAFENAFSVALQILAVSPPETISGSSERSNDTELSNSIELAIGICLDVVAKTALRFDGSDLEFCANVMWYVEAESETGQQWKDKVLFRAPNSASEGARGFLVLSKSFVRRSSDVSTSNSDETEIALEIPKTAAHTSNSGTHHNVLPGAPWVFQESHKKQELSIFSPAVDVKQWLEKYGNFSPSVIGDVVKYFESNANLAGFMSMPINKVEVVKVDEPRSEPLGVLNIDWNGPPNFLDNDSAQKLGDILNPLRTLLAALMEKYLSELGAPKPGNSEK